MTIYTAALPTGAARHRQKYRPTGVKIYFPNLHLSYHTWSDGRKLPDTDQFVSSEAFMKKRSKLAP